MSSSTIPMVPAVPLSPSVLSLLSKISSRLVNHSVQSPPSPVPYVTLTYALSLDGSIGSAHPAPHSVALSSTPSLVFTHALRSLHSAILVGVGTVLSDNPRLTNRLFHPPADVLTRQSAKSATMSVSLSRQPKPVVLDATLRTPPTCRLVVENVLKPILVSRRGGDSTVQARRALLEAAGCTVLEVEAPSHQDHSVALTGVLIALRSAGITSVMVEGGAHVIAAMIAPLFSSPSADPLAVSSSISPDLVVLTMCPVFLGGINPAQYLPSAATSSPGASRKEMAKLHNVSYTLCGVDILIYGETMPRLLIDKDVEDLSSDGEEGGSPVPVEPSSAPLSPNTGDGRYAIAAGMDHYEAGAVRPGDAVRPHVQRTVKIRQAVRVEEKLYEGKAEGGQGTGTFAVEKGREKMRARRKVTQQQQAAASVPRL